MEEAASEAKPLTTGSTERDNSRKSSELLDLLGNVGAIVGVVVAAVGAPEASVPIIGVGVLGTAVAALLKGLASRRRTGIRTVEAEPDVSRTVSYSKLGDLAHSTDNLVEAERAYRDALTIQRLADSDPANTEWQHDLSISYSKLGDLARANDNLAEAERAYHDALTILDRLFGPNSTEASELRAKLNQNPSTD